MKFLSEKIMSGKTAIALLFLSVAAVYFNSLASGFVWDDESLIVGRAAFFSNVKNIFTIFTTGDNIGGIVTPYYRPLSVLVRMLDFKLWGLNPFWYHLENVLFHAAAVLLLYFLVLEFFESEVLAFFSALFFALYPVNAEAVNFISANNTMLCAVLVLASLHFLGRRGLKWSLLSLGAYFLSLLSKESSVIMPFFLLSLTLTSREEKFKTRKDVLAGYFAVTIVYMILRRFVLGSLTSKTGFDLSADNLKVVSNVIFEGLRLMVYPFRLNAYYTKASMTAFNWLKAFAAVFGLGILLSLSFGRKVAGPVRAGAQWFFWGLLPISGIIPIPSCPVAERFYYLPVAGFVLIAAYLLEALYRRKKAVGLALFVLLFLSFGLRTFERNFVWQNEMSLYKSMVLADPGNGDAYNNLGTAYIYSGNFSGALEALQTSKAINPYSSEVHNDIGMAYAGLHRLDEAMMEIRLAVALRPDSEIAHNNLGAVYAKLGRYEDAVSEFRIALKIYPGYTQAQVNLGLAEEKLKNKIAPQAK